MLDIRPNCECCNRDLPAQSTDARICSYECTFCASCVENVLMNVCPNCGGGFVNRPIRPKVAYREGTSLEHQPASNKAVASKYSRIEISDFVRDIKAIEPELR